MMANTCIVQCWKGWWRINSLNNEIRRNYKGLSKHRAIASVPNNVKFITSLTGQWARGQASRLHAHYRGLATRPPQYAKRRATTTSASSLEKDILYILGIETSCDDTGAAVVSDTGEVLGESHFNQHNIHLRYGGIIPVVAKDLHKKKIEEVVTTAMAQAGMSFGDLDAIATTVKPGMPMSLSVGTNYGKSLALSTGKPFIPIHHMEAHALTVRMVEKGARRLKLRNIPECATMSGGQAIEHLAVRGDPHAFEFPTPMWKYRDCTFSFSGLKNAVKRITENLEEQYEIEGGSVLPCVEDICASYQYAITKHLVRQTHKAMLFVDVRDLLPKENRILVVSGGVACNQYIRAALQKLCSHTGYQLFCPPPKLCTDNGIMIAWNGMERWKAQTGVLYNKQEIEDVTFEARCAIGEDLTEDVRNLGITVKKWVKF
ncbi:probable tRNA N6-adenosine threonylcarbamoyltransferase, mitochondrial isoform X3 [Portunus trituberculatus]|uniref:probable tRNA N6-adenosine threonylcarbamoyltransferase, mitochondrial isoform X3 n=1 Tax=Portunus trituberculatus TaxID=210409 RepID=UPI001E1D0703|nr:probable tRNA N6-adenosine threonylcarbamoyltransferase, mitochondrial isoform X3 [Portunus trituberculatus]